MSEEVHIHEFVEDLGNYEVYCSGCPLRGFIVIPVNRIVQIRVRKKVGTNAEDETNEED